MTAPADFVVRLFKKGIEPFAGLLRSRRQARVLERTLETLHSIGTALAAERDLDRLLELVLEKLRTVLSADAGSIFLAEGPSPDKPTHLRFRQAQNDSVQVGFKEFVIPINPQSLAGYVAAHRATLRFDDVYKIPPDLPFSFFSEVDHKTGYRSKSVLSAPMEDHRGCLIGVIQLWNKKRNRSAILTPASIASEVVPFTEGDERLLVSIAGQAGIALENAKLYEEIDRLFKGFIRASVSAIESRDPTTRGHSEHVARLTLALAQAVDRMQRGPYADLHFGAQDLRELEYAALLHDFGKIGVREPVLVKAKKLYPSELELAQTRFDLLRRWIQLDSERKKVRFLSEGGTPGDAGWKDLDLELERKLKEVNAAFEHMERTNEPRVLPGEASKTPSAVGGLKVLLPSGREIPLLTQDQVSRLSMPQGTLSNEERLEIESHVTHTYRYLANIPWTRDLQNVPAIAYAHHEKLDGSGYPRKLQAKDIPVSSRIMAVADIFDALTAGDRPYKSAVSVPKALEILRLEAQAKKLDPELVRIFIDGKVYELPSPDLP